MSSTIRLPGLIDAHVHLRSPGGEHKEDYASGSAAALAGGFTRVLAMPNTRPPLVTLSTWQEAQARARREALCDVELLAGASPAHLDELVALGARAVGLKLYMDETYGPLRMTALPDLAACFRRWPCARPIAVHAEGASVAAAIGLAAAHGRAVHICHVSRRAEVELIAAARERGLPVTCEVAPHHLFLTADDAARLGTLGDMRPTLGTADDQAALWEGLGRTIDCVATDHAPHTLDEKRGLHPPPGVPGLETALPLLLDAVHQGRLAVELLIALLHDNPRRIYNLPAQPDTWVEVDLAACHTLSNDDLYTKCGWTPFAGLQAHGRVVRVCLRGCMMVVDGRVIATLGAAGLQEGNDGL